MAGIESAQDILRLAVEMEDRAAAFYRGNAETHPKHRDVLLKLAEMEAGHAETFKSMLGGLPEGAAARPRGEEDSVPEYLLAIAGEHGGEGKDQEPLRWNAPFEEILRHAIEQEKTAVLFYTWLKGSLPAQTDTADVDDVIEQEMGHIGRLYAILKAGEG